jgi:hypothetical protein
MEENRNKCREYWGARRDDHDNELKIDNVVDKVKGVKQTRGQSELDHLQLYPTKHFLLVRF